MENGGDQNGLATPPSSHKGSHTLPGKFEKAREWDELDELLQVERKLEPNEKPYQTLPGPITSRPDSGSKC